MNKITLLIDHPKRDLMFNTLIAKKIGRNVKIDLQDGYFTPDGPNFFTRIKGESLIVSPSYNVIRSRYITLRKKITNSKLVIFHSEQFITKNEYEEKLNLTNFNKYNNNVDFHLVWGQYFKDLLLEHGVNEDKIKIVGNPKFEILDRLYGKLKKTNNLSVLFISNFNYADFEGEVWDKFKSDYSLNIDDDSNVHFANARKNFISNVLEVANKFQDLNIIVRLHPGEPSHGYKELFNISNIEISNNNNLLIDLARSKLVFQFTSSVIFEAIHLNIPCFAISYTNMPTEYLQPPSNEFKWYEMSQVVDIIKDFKGYESSFSKENWTYYFSDISDSTNVISNFLVSINTKKYKFNFLQLFTLVGLEFLFKNLFCYIFTKTIFSNLSFFKNKISNSYNSWKENDHFITDTDIENLKLLDL